MLQYLILGFAQPSLFAKCINLFSCEDLDLKKDKQNHYFSFLQHSWLGEEERRNFISEYKKQSRKICSAGERSMSTVTTDIFKPAKVFKKDTIFKRSIR